MASRNYSLEFIWSHLISKFLLLTVFSLHAFLSKDLCSVFSDQILKSAVPLYLMSLFQLLPLAFSSIFSFQIIDFRMFFLKIVHLPLFFFIVTGNLKTNTNKGYIINPMYPSSNFNSYQLMFCPEYVIVNPRHEDFYSYVLHCLFITDKAFVLFNIISMPLSYLQN